MGSRVPGKRGITVFNEFESINARDEVSVLREQEGKRVKQH